MRSGLHGAYFPSIWQPRIPKGEGDLGGRELGTGRIDPPSAPPCSTARRPSEANLHTVGHLKLPRPCGAGWDRLASSVDTRDPARDQSPEPLARAPYRGCRKLGAGGQRWKLRGWERADGARPAAREGRGAGPSRREGRPRPCPGAPPEPSTAREVGFLRLGWLRERPREGFFATFPGYPPLLRANVEKMVIIANIYGRPAMNPALRQAFYLPRLSSLQSPKRSHRRTHFTEGKTGAERLSDLFKVMTPGVKPDPVFL